jgi:ribosomal-protein-alanine N-acetyltransferase
MSEAARRIVQFGFEELNLTRIQATYLTENTASRRVMEKIGMTYEGTLRSYVQKWEKDRDLGMCAILRSEWEAS